MFFTRQFTAVKNKAFFYQTVYQAFYFLTSQFTRGRFACIQRRNFVTLQWKLTKGKTTMEKTTKTKPKPKGKPKATANPKAKGQLKAAVTMPTIDERAAYAHYHEHRRHIASFCGTGNNVQFLSDPTGNRRWLPFEVESIDSPRDKPFNYDGIYAQAYRLYRDGFTFWFSADEVRQLARHNAYYETPRLENELVDQYFRKPTPSEPGEFMPVSVALQIIGSTLTQKLSAIMVGRAFKDMGFQSRKSNQVRGYIVVRRSSEEIAQRRQLLASGTDGTDGTEVF